MASPHTRQALTQLEHWLVVAVVAVSRPPPPPSSDSPLSPPPPSSPEVDWLLSCLDITTGLPLGSADLETKSKFDFWGQMEEGKSYDMNELSTLILRPTA